PDAAYIAAHIAEAIHALDERQYAAMVLDRLRPYVAYNTTLGGTAMCRGSTAHFVALLQTTLGQYAEAEQHFEQALAFNRKLQAPPFLARTQYEYASMLAKNDRAGDEQRALVLVDQALATAESLGMTRLSEQALALKVRVQGILKA
ncbi:MAG: hypothetical protein DCC58_20475, partial [Chloroflexi bacterium]